MADENNQAPVAAEETKEEVKAPEAEAPKAEEKPAEEKKEEPKEEPKKEVEVPTEFKTIVESIEKLSVLQLADLVKVLEEKFGVSAAPTAVGVAGSGSEGGAEEKSEFDVELTEIGGNKIGVIKAVREITALGLKEAKDMVDAAPKVIKEGVPKAEAEEMKKKIEEAGGTAVLK
ncbi:50S ribosomal protein L7/L12 [Patescibacteria group bacterium]|nr:50S ribosomal protein L7/L12 [Patescibacteria group bacterium]